MTRFRFVSLCLVALLCLGIAAPVAASPPLIVPAGIEAPADPAGAQARPGLIERLNETLDRILAWFAWA